MILIKNTRIKSTLLKSMLFTILAALFLMITPRLNAQESLKADYERAISFLWENVNNKKAFNLSIRPNWLPDSTGLWHLQHDQSGKSFKKVSFSKLQKEALFDHQRLAAFLTKKLGEEVKANELPFDYVRFPDNGSIQFSVKNKNYELDLDSYKLSEVKEEAKEDRFQSKSPDGKWVAYSKNYNLYLRSVETDEIRQLSTDGEKNFEYGSYYGWYDIMKGENAERPRHFSVNWSPDSKYLQTYICDLRSAQKMYLLDWSKDTLYRPELLSYYRGSPGDTGMVYMIPVLFDIESGREISTELPRNTHINLVSFQWSDEPEKIYARYAERGYQKEHVLQLNLKEKKQISLITETSRTNIDNFSFWKVEKKGKLIFASERSGWRQLYAVDLKSKAITPITTGNYYVNDVEYIDEEKGFVYFLASGKEKGRNPYHQHLYKASLDGSQILLLTPEDAHHQIDFSPDGQFFFDNYSTATIPTKSVLREAANGKIVLKIAEADIKNLTAMNWSPPQLFEAIGRDGYTTIYGALWKPSNFDPNKKYPIIDHSYTGPHIQMFPKDFRRVLSLNNQALAELGFIVMMVDGLGSSGRSKAFHNFSYKKMGLNLTDHVLAINQLGSRFDWIDTERVGIFGHSAGAYDAAHALLEFPDFYKVAVASSGDHDHRMEKAWWPEMYMGWPVDEAYHEQSNITMADRLKGKLLLVHGGIDDNVNPSATFKLTEALIKADKEFDLLIIPSQRHGYRGSYSKYFLKKRWNYFVEHLLGVEPVWNVKWE